MARQQDEPMHSETSSESDDGDDDDDDDDEEEEEVGVVIGCGGGDVHEYLMCLECIHVTQ